jgi:small subunit ribosomal protein S16
MLKIKLARFGKRNQPHYRIVVNEARDKRDGKYIALLGNYSPSYQPKVLELDLKAYENWMAKGAQPTATVAALYQRVKSGKLFPEKKARLSKKAQAKLKAAKEEKVEKKAEKPVKETGDQVAEQEAPAKPADQVTEQEAPAKPADQVTEQAEAKN